MISHFSNKIINVFWWILAPLLFAKITITISMFFLPNFNIEKKEGDKLFAHRYSFPKFFLDQKIKQTLLSTVQISTNYDFKNVKLLGCYIEKNHSFVILSYNDKTTFVDLNQKFQNAILKEIGINYAIFIQNSKKIKLRMQQEKSINNNLKENSQNNKIKQTINISKQDMLKYKKNFMSAINDLQIQEIWKNNIFKGIKIAYIKKNSLFDKMGLKKNDIVKDINGKKLKGLQDLLPYYNAIDTLSSIHIGIIRNNKYQEIIYEIY